ncbi:MAG: hypothetical protein EPO07_13930 [Verrucomicrobia bacterium]|nr:MAG: hypothetical protein EPO07_13930 [Verrucomicrobiota bacterium]
MRTSTIILFGALFALLGCGGSDVKRIPFEAVAWKRAPSIEQHRTVRSQMIDDLLRHHKFSGWTRQQVIELLGEPTPGEPAKMGFPQWDIVYVLGLERAGAYSLDDEALGFKFDAQDRVSKYGVTPN